jgi:hypothetical protein
MRSPIKTHVPLIYSRKTDQNEKSGGLYQEQPRQGKMATTNLTSFDWSHLFVNDTGIDPAKAKSVAKNVP